MSEPVEDVQDDSLTIFNFMDNLLEHVNNTFQAAGVSLPARQIFEMGSSEAVINCETVAVYFQQMYNGVPGNPDQIPTPCNGPRTGTFIVEIHRCVPKLKQVGQRGVALASEEDLRESARIQTQDAWLLMDAGLTAATDFGLMGGLADIVVGPEQGQYQPVILNLVVGLQ